MRNVCHFATFSLLSLLFGFFSCSPSFVFYDRAHMFDYVGMFERSVDEGLQKPAYRICIDYDGAEWPQCSVFDPAYSCTLGVKKIKIKVIPITVASCYLGGSGVLPC